MLRSSVIQLKTKRNNFSTLTIRRVCGFFFAAFLAGTFTAQAVVDANSRANTNAPPDGAPWGNVGTVNGLSGIYLANGWVLTAAHAGFGTFTLGSQAFTYDGNYRQLTNLDGSVTDALMFHLTTPPPVPILTVVSNGPSPGAFIDMVGFGYYSGSSQMTFGTNTGFGWSSTPGKSWGSNKVVDNGILVRDQVGVITSFYSDFAAPGSAQTANEGQAASGDSGGAVFQQTGSGWQLAGIMFGINQLQGGGTAVYGDLTFAVDVASYRSQVMAILASTAPVMAVSRSGTNLLVCWVDTGLPYDLEKAATIAPANWATVPQPQFSTNALRCVRIPITSTNTFFRLQKSPPITPGVVDRVDHNGSFTIPVPGNLQLNPATGGG
jgi:hypothetical protein